MDVVGDGYIRVSYAPDLYFVEDGRAAYVNAKQWAAAGRPSPRSVVEIPGTVYSARKGESHIYASLPGRDTFLLTFRQWADAGSPSPTTVAVIPGSEFMKTSSHARIYAVAPGGSSTALTREEWDAVGSPAPTIVAAIPGSRILRTHGWPSVYAVAPDDVATYLNLSDWVSMGRPSPRYVVAIPGSRFVTIPDSPVIYAQAPDGAPTRLSYEQWRSVGSPRPTVIPAVPRSSYYRTADVATVWAVGPDGNARPISAADYRALGRPSVRVIAWTPGLRAVSSGELWASYRAGCPVGPDRLLALDISYWGFDHRPRRGTVVVAREAVNAVDATFRAAFNAHFPFRGILPIEFYGGDDVRSMAAGNTSAFNCRTVTGNPRRLSQHSFGNAIDYNTFENPYVTGSRVYPSGSETYLDRSNVRPGMIVPGSAVEGTMRAWGWLWGARWAAPDYQHFSSNGG